MLFSSLSIFTPYYRLHLKGAGCNIFHFVSSCGYELTAKIPTKKLLEVIEKFDEMWRNQNCEELHTTLCESNE